MGPDSFGNLSAPFILRPLQVLVRLEIHPELGSRAEVARQPKGGVSGNRPFAPSDIVDACNRHHQFDG